MGFLTNIWTWLIGLLAGMATFGRSLIFIKLQLPSYISTYLLDKIKKDAKKIEFEYEYINHRLPRTYRTLAYMNGTIFYFSINGGSKSDGEGSDVNGTLICFRWHILKILEPLTAKIHESQITNKAGIYIVQEWSAEKVGNIDTEEKIIPYLDKEIYEPLENDIKDVLASKRKKVGALLYGLPGNGKSYLIRYFAVKYKLPIYIFSLQRELNNQDIIRMFNNINPPGIVIFEDFDAYFNKRTSKLNRANFTFDTILNGLDGLFCDGRKLIYFMTTNRIQEIDESIKDRPSRFKYCINISNPNEQIRKRIFSNNSEIIKKTKGYTLDKCLWVKEMEDNNLDSKKLHNYIPLGKKPKKKAIKKKTNKVKASSKVKSMIKKALSEDKKKI